MLNWTTCVKPHLPPKKKPWFLPDRENTWTMLKPTARFFMWKKKFFLLKKIPKKKKYFYYTINVGMRDRGLINRVRWTDWASSQTLNKGWLIRLKNKANFFQMRWRYKTLMYRFKKKLKKLNQENRRRFIRLLFPELTQNDLTEFFLQTKNAPKFLMTDMLTHTKIHKQESLNWVISLNAILPWLYSLSQANLILHAETPCTNSKIRTQVPVSSHSLKVLNYYWNKNRFANLQANSFTKDIFRYRTIRGSYRFWSDPQNAKLNLEHLEALDAVDVKKRIFAKQARWKKKRKFLLRNQYKRRYSLHSQIQTQKYKQRYPNYRGLKRRKRNPRQFNKMSSKIQAKTQTLETLQDSFMYDYRILHQIELVKKTTYKKVPHRTPDLNLFNFRTFNWQILT